MFKKFFALVLFSSAVCAQAPAQSTIVLSDFGTATDGQFQSGAVQYGVTGAMVFSTGSSYVYIESITAQLDLVSPFSQTLRTALYLAPNGVPTGAPVYTEWSAPVINGDKYTFSSPSVGVQPNTEYAFAIWGPGTVTWDQKDIPNGFTSIDGWAMHGFTQGNNNGTWWPANDNSRFFASGEIIAVVPEPSSWLLMGSGIAVIIGLRRHKQCRI